MILERASTLSATTCDDIYNPDNMDASDRVLMIQEDRESAFRDPPFSGGFGRVMEYRFSNQSLRSVARVATPPPLRPGTWESSGIINAGDLLGRGWWFLDVQAHSTTAPQPGPSLRTELLHRRGRAVPRSLRAGKPVINRLTRDYPRSAASTSSP